MIMRAPATLLERVGDLGPDLVDRALGVHLHKLACCAVVLDDRLGLLVVVAQPPLDRLGLVVGAALDARRASCSRSRAVSSESSSRSTTDERPADLLEHLVERLGLREVAREAVEDEAVLRVAVAQPRRE